MTTESEYNAALKRISELMDMDLQSNSEASDEFDILSLVVEDYEKKHYPVPPPEPIGAIKFRMTDELKLELDRRYAEYKEGKSIPISSSESKKRIQKIHDTGKKNYISL